MTPGSNSPHVGSGSNSPHVGSGLSRTLRQIFVVFRKELTDSLRDRRALYSIAFSVLLGPLMVGFMMNRVADRQREADNVTIPIVGRQYAPALVDWLTQQGGIAIVDGPENPEQAVRDEQQDLVVIIAPDFAEDFRVSRPAAIRIVSDSSRNSARPRVQRVRQLLQRYSQEIGALRLIARGVSPTAVSALRLEDVEVSTSQQRAAQILGFLPMFIILAGFVGGMQIATDATAGERERGSLEPLLVNPAPRGAFVGGKWLAAASVAIISAVLTTILCMNLPRFLSLQDMGVRFRLGPEYAGSILVAVLPVCLFTAALQAFVATFARSFKEAQSYMGFLMLVPMVPGMMSALYPLGNATWMYAVPMLGSHVLLTNVIGGQSVAMWSYLLPGAVALIAAAILLHLTTRLFKNERIIFAR
jgi:sodium transport system permease protein